MAVDGEPDPDEAAAAEAAAEGDDPATTARGWLLATSTATLCTTSVQRGIEGWPFGSVAPFALDAEGRPFVLIADIAAHTANLRRDPRASLLVRQPDEPGCDPQAGWRVTVMGTLVRVDGDEDGLEARYVERVPAARQYRATHGFAFWRMDTVAKVRYIAGFGRITWLEGASVLRDPGGEGMAAAGPGAIAHMNEDHAENLREMCRGLYGFTPEAARMSAIDRAGFEVRTVGPERRLHFSFGREIGAGELRGAVIDVLRRARAVSVAE